MAIGNVFYKSGSKVSDIIDPIVDALISMNQEVDKSDEPEILAEKIKNISKDATAIEDNVLDGKTFYADGVKKTGNITSQQVYTNAVNCIKHSTTNDLYSRIPKGAYLQISDLGYPEIITPYSNMKSAGYALQTDLDNMTQNKDYYYNQYKKYYDLYNGKPTLINNFKLQIPFDDYSSITYPSYFDFLESGANSLLIIPRRVRKKSNNEWTTTGYSNYFYPLSISLAYSGDYLLAQEQTTPESSYMLMYFRRYEDSSSFSKFGKITRSWYASPETDEVPVIDIHAYGTLLGSSGKDIVSFYIYTDKIVNYITYSTTINGVELEFYFLKI